MEEDIGYFEVSMHGFDFVQALKSINDLLEEVGCLVLGQTLLLLQISLEITAIAVLHDDADALVGMELINKSDDIIVLALSEDFDFSLYEFLELGSVHHEFFWDDFDSHLRLISLVDGLVDFGPRSLAKSLEEIEGFQLGSLQLFVLH